MNATPVIRDETAADHAAITAVTVAAFADLEISNQTEQFIIDALRAAGALTISLVAEIDSRVVGHIAFSPVTLSDGTPNWYGLGPLSVLPDLQGQGIGSALIREGLSRLRDLDAGGCCLVGHPQYYRKFGFGNPPGLACEGVPAEYFFALSFDGRLPQGTVAFHEAFGADGQSTEAGDAAGGDPRLSDAFDVWELTGWNAGYRVSREEFVASWRASKVRKCIVQDGKVVAIGRANTDGVLYSMIQDVVVHPEYRGRGLGRAIVRALIEELQRMNVRSIQLMAARGQVPFYEGLGFTARPADGPGMQFGGTLPRQGVSGDEATPVTDL